MSEESSSINQKQLAKLEKKAKQFGYENLSFFIEDIDVLLRPSNLLKEKDMKYFELENLISLLDSKKISLGMAPRMISMVSKYSERNEELEEETANLKQENITLKSKHQTADAQAKELQSQLQNLSAAPQADAKIRETNIKLTEESKYLKITNESLSTDLKKIKDKYEEKLEEANDLEVENSQLEMRMKDLQRELKEVALEFEEERKKGKESGSNKTLENIEKIIEELDEIYGTVDDPFKKEFLAFLGVELSEIIDNRHITKQKILNQIAIHAHEIEKIFEPKIAALTRQYASAAPVQQTAKAKDKKPTETIPEPAKRKPVETASATEEVIDDDPSDSYVKPSDFLKGKGVSKAKPKDKEDAEGEKEQPELDEGVKVPKVAYTKRKSRSKKPAKIDRTPSPELVKVIDVFIKYIEAINDTSSFNDICDKFIEQMYEHVGSPGMTKVYKIKSGGVKRKQMLIDLLTAWKKQLPEM
ncbi:MAG: hypothetical protein ACTSQK_00515 [Candidatus Heimdallarchaeota archaeon]